MRSKGHDVITEDAVRDNQQKTADNPESNVYALSRTFGDEIDAAKALAERLRIPYVDPFNARIEPEALALLNPEIAMSQRVLPIRRVNDILLVAMARPDQSFTIIKLEIVCGCKIRPAAASKSALAIAIQKVYGTDGMHVEAAGPQTKTAPKLKAPAAWNKLSSTIAVVSNKGGVGKTHFSINLAYSLGAAGARVLLIDADLGNADISNKLALFPKQDLMNFLMKDCGLVELIIRTGHPFNLIGGSSGEFRLANVNYAQKLKFIKHFKQLSRQYDYTIFDLGAGIGRNVLDFALAADQTIIVTTPQDLISGYACAKACFMRHMEIEERFEQKLSGYELSQEYRPYMVINQVADQREGMRIFKTIEKTADENINANEPRFTIRPEYLGAVLYDKETMRKTESLHKPLLQQFPYSKAAQCIRHISSKFINPQHRYDPRIKVGHRLRRFASVLSNMV